LLDLIDLVQAKYCDPVFLCRPNNECFDPDGIYNPKIGWLNNALASCGISATIYTIEDVSNLDSSNFNESACNQSCCNALYAAVPYCETSTTYALFENLLVHYQGYECSNNIICNLTATAASGFSIAGLSFLASVGVCIGAAIGGLIIVCSAVVLICKRR